MSVLPSARDLIRSATKQRGLDSIAAMPVKGGLNLAGRAMEALGLRAKNATGLGDDLVNRYILGPSETFTSGVGSALGEIPGFGRLFKYKLRPDDVIDATKGGIKLSDEQFRHLTQQANAGELFTHRLTAPLESKGMYNVVLPMLAGMYVQDQYNKEKTPEQKAQERYNAKNMGIYHSLMGNRSGGSVKTGGIEMTNDRNGQSASRELLVQAADTIDHLTALNKQVSMEKNAAVAENNLLRQALSLVNAGSLDISYADDFVKEGMRKHGMTMSSPSPNLPSRSNADLPRLNSGDTSSLTSLYSSTESYIPKHATGTLRLHEPHAGGGSGSRGGSGVTSRTTTAKQVMDDFVLS